MTEPKSSDLHIRVTAEEMAAIDAMAAADRRKRSDMARVLLAEAVAVRRARDNQKKGWSLLGEAYTAARQPQDEEEA